MVARRVKRRQARLRATFGKFAPLALRVLYDLDMTDPVGIVSEWNPAEYAAEVETMLPRLLEQAHSREDVDRILREEFVSWFGDSARLESCRARYERAADRIWQTLWAWRSGYLTARTGKPNTVWRGSPPVS